MKRWFPVLLAAVLGTLAACSSGLKDPVGPALSLVSPDLGDYVILTSTNVYSVETVSSDTNLSGNLVGPSPPYFYGANTEMGKAGLSTVTEDGNSFRRVEWDLYGAGWWWYWVVYAFSSSPGGDPIPFRVVDLRRYGNAVMFRARSPRIGGSQVAILQLQALSKAPDGLSVVEIPLATEWREYVVPFSRFKPPAFTAPVDWSRVIAFNWGVVHVPGVKMYVDIDDLRIVRYSLRR